jgi:DNA repair exonuclease SbcCD nuclease subunit
MRFLHTADWQLGMTRHFLSEEAQSRFTDARLQAVRALGQIAVAQRCGFVLVCGDVFESNLLSPQVVGRALEAMRSIPLPVYLLPGNHDPMDAASVYRSREFTQRCPENVHVLADPGIYQVESGVEIVAAPWDTKRPLADLAARQVHTLAPADGVVRVLAAHGAIDSLSPDRTGPARISLSELRAALADGRIHYVGLGDRHSLTEVEAAIWYSGAPEVTDYDETAPGNVLVVDVDEHAVQATAHRVGTWQFVRRQWQLGGPEDVADLRQWLDRQPDKERTMLKLGLVGTLTVRDKATLDQHLEATTPLYAGVQTWERRHDLAVISDEQDFAGLHLSGFAAATLAELNEMANAGGPTATTAEDALGLLYRLGREPA